MLGFGYVAGDVVGQSQRRLGHVLHVDVGLTQHEEERVVVVDPDLRCRTQKLVDLARLEALLDAVEGGVFTFLAGKAKLTPGDKGAAAFVSALAVGAAPVHLVSGDQRVQVRIGLLVGQPTGNPFLDPRQYRLRIVLSNDGGVSDPQEHVVVRSVTCLVFLLPVEVVYLAEYRAFLHDGAKEGVESQRKLPGHRDGVLGAELADVVRRQHVIDLPEVAGNFGGLVFGTSEGEEEGGRTPLTYHASELVLSGKPELLGATHRLKHGGQIVFECLVRGLHLVQEHANGHGLRSKCLPTALVFPSATTGRRCTVGLCGSANPC